MRMPAGISVGKTLAELPIRQHGSSIIAIYRKGSFLTRMDPAMKIEAGDEVFICGNGEALREIAL